jgi:hypothetical protein
MKIYNQFYTSSIFNIKNNINYNLETTFINIFTEKDLEVFNKIEKKQIIYNNDLYFFNCLNIIKKVIQTGIPIYSNNIKIRRYLYENGVKLNFIQKKYIQVHNNINLTLFNHFEISSDNKYPLVIRFQENIGLIIERLKKKLPLIIVNNINIFEIEEAVCNNRLLYIENVDEFIKGITNNLYISESFCNLGEKFKKSYLKKDYNNSETCIFLGISSQILKKHDGIKFLIWGETDFNLNNIEEIKNISNVYHFSSSKKIQEKLNLNNINNIYFDIIYERDYDYSDVLIIMNNGKKYHGEICNIKLLESIHIDYVFFNNIHKINYKKYNYILIDGLLLNEILTGISNDSLLNIINSYFKNKTLILLFHDLHFWSHNSYLIRNINKRNPINLLSTNKYFFNNIQYYENMNVKYYISLYNCLEFHNIVSNSNFIKSSYINYYPTFNDFNNISVDKIYNILIYGSIVEYIYPLRKKLYDYLNKGLISNTKLIENVNNIDNSTNGIELNKLINSSWLSVATTSLFNYYLKKYNEIGNTSSVIIGNITSEIKNVIGDNYIYVNNYCSYDYFIELIKYYLNNKPTICYINYNCNENLKKNNFIAYEQRMKEIMKNIKYNEYTELEYNNYNKTCNLIDVNNYFYIQKNVSQEDNTILMTNNIYNELKLITKENNDYYYYYKKTENTINNYNGNFYKIIKYKIIDQMYSNTLFENIEKYHSKNKPSFFHGIFNNTDIINSHNDIKIIILTENDTKYIDNNELIKYNNNKNTYIISVSNLISVFLDKLYIKYIYEPNFLNKSNNILVYTEIYYKFNINYYFDRIYVLNLKKDVNKRERIKTIFNKYNINNYEFFEGIYGREDKELLNEYDIYSKIPFDSREKKLKRKLIGSVGVLANLLSVRNIIIDAKNKNYKNILFLEDDIYLHNNFNSLFINRVSKLDNWKILYLGIQNNLDNKIIMNNLYDADINSSGGWSFGIDCSVYDELINECNKRNLPFDSGPLWYMRSHYPTQCKVIYPNLIICDISTSSIRDDKRNLKKSYKNFKWNIEEYNICGLLLNL